MLDKTYDPASIEARIWAAWEKANAFAAGRPDLAPAKRKAAAPYCIVIPPPNVTGSLHMGHALNNSLQDILCRFERMRGRDVLWQPGTDHAGIATQMVVERQMMEKQEPDRRKIGREKFVEKVWAWKAESGGTIVNQLKRLGASCDWGRERFTMDEGLSKAVLKVFVDLYNAGLIYKDKRLVNWDPHFQTAISDLEVEQRESKGSFKWSPADKDKAGDPVPFNAAALGKVLDRDPGGHMYYFRYPLEGAAFSADDPSTYLVVATTRPETMLGDTAVAVHPEHPRYASWIGKRLSLPLVGRSIPIVGDEYADPEKGTGAVKITPAHDFNDFEVGKRHADKLVAPINIFDEHAALNQNVPKKYQGLDRFGARKAVVADLVAQGLVERIEPHAHTVPHGDRSGSPVEPWLTDQWYVNAAEMAKPALAAVREGKTTFIPERFAGDYVRWLENIQPWCISRQLWWGHQIPVWYGRKPHPDPSGSGLHTIPFELVEFCAETETEAIAQAKQLYGREVRVGPRPDAFTVTRDIAQSRADVHGPTAPVEIWRDPDVLDTWFSSALWPFSTLGWPEQTPELARYYPTQVLVTGFDIIFFWVARMMMMGLHFKGEVPFREVYIHGLVRDAQGRKMSKTLRNTIDPLDLIEELGADALRFTLASMAAQGGDVRFSKARVEGYRNFATKLWNAARFAEINGCARAAGFDPAKCKETVNRWIAGETERAAAEVTRALEEYKFNDAAGAVYRFIWNIVCDWYLELIKPVLASADAAAQAETRACAAWVLDQAMALLHPFMPFLTEELWAKTGEIGPKRAALLALSEWPRLEGLADPKADEEMGWIIRLVSEVRSVRSEMNVPAAAKAPLVLAGAKKATRERAERHAETIERLARIESLSFDKSAPKGSVQIVLDEAVAALPLAGLVDLGAEVARLKKEIGKAEGEVAKVEGKLANKAFVDKAPPEVVEENRERLAEHAAVAKRLKAALKRIEAAG
jgi:valyl-tRNA synthetase